MRIAIVGRPWIEVPPLGHGGVERVCATLIAELVRRGHDVTLIGVGRDGTQATFHATYPEPQMHHGVSLIPELAHAARARQLLADGGFDVVHDHTLIGPLLGPAGGTPVLSTVHDPLLGYETSEKYTLLGDYYEALGPAANLVAISRAQRAARPGLNWVGTVHNGVDVDSLPFNGGNRDEFVLWLARFIPGKAPDLAIRAAREAGLPLVLAGRLGAQERPYFDEAVRPLLGDGVELIANPGQDEAMGLLSRARCLLHPVRFAEPFGMVLAEAAACGTPVVGMNRGAVAEVVIDGVTGWICDDPADLATALHRAGEINPVVCRERVARNFSARAMAEGYERVYRAVANL
ncbi:MAG: glycosyltransferase family 4 protein [Mycobacteriales bacterium]